jgi:hypothetical protein
MLESMLYLLNNILYLFIIRELRLGAMELILMRWVDGGKILVMIGCLLEAFH